MSDSGSTLLRTVYDAFAQGDLDTAMASLADDIEWRVYGPSPVAGTYRGKDAVGAFFPRMMAQYEGTLRVQVTAMLADDQHGFVTVNEAAERPGEGVAYRGVHVWGFRDGKCASFESYYDDTYAQFWTAQSTSPPETDR
jgi:ketosteroid isomerase-like protein